MTVSAPVSLDTEVPDVTKVSGRQHVSFCHVWSLLKLSLWPALHPRNSRVHSSALSSGFPLYGRSSHRKTCVSVFTWLPEVRRPVFTWVRLETSLQSADILYKTKKVLEYFFFFFLGSVAVNPCLRQPCHVHASCVHTGPNQHLCACHEGYSGDGRICMAVDPCQIKQGGCDSESAKCVYDGPGKVRGGRAIQTRSRSRTTIRPHMFHSGVSVSLWVSFWFWPSIGWCLPSERVVSTWFLSCKRQLYHSWTWTSGVSPVFPQSFLTF